jgi:hypothetical protein
MGNNYLFVYFERLIISLWLYALLPKQLNVLNGWYMNLVRPLHNDVFEQIILCRIPWWNALIELEWM